MSQLLCVLPAGRPAAATRLVLLIVVLAFVVALAALGSDPALALSVALTAVNAIVPVDPRGALPQHNG
ncbi:hypothetical protein ACIBHX_28250 [Nonomuraea sp. NPDC050536]|uniref:hypothetical protein n=1 Tax=Nonomuraea sp. NPDC050536 TaxID=3364366 RepID=UPI0037CC259E